VIYTTVESRIAKNVQPVAPNRLIRDLVATPGTAWLVSVWKPCGFTDLNLSVRDDTATGVVGWTLPGNF
jgi:hypothetical protein